MQMINPIWIMLKLTMRPSVLCTVAKLRFSRVRKYFWFLLMVESWPEILKMDSSRTEVCSGDVPCLEGSWARDSFSTYMLDRQLLSFKGQDGQREQSSTYGDLEVDELLGEGTHFVVEAERVVTRLLRCKDKVSLSLLLARENDLAVRALNLVIDIERTAGLHLDHPN